MSNETMFIIGLSYLFVMKIVCFVIGFFIVRIGASLLRDGISGQFTFKYEFTGVKGDLASASPGLLFLLLGCLLIGYSLALDKVATYEKTETSAGPAAGAMPLPEEDF